MKKSVRELIRAAARHVTVETFENPTEKDYQAILSGMLKAAPKLLQAAHQVAPEAEPAEVDQVVIKAMKKAAQLVFESGPKGARNI